MITKGKDIYGATSLSGGHPKQMFNKNITPKEKGSFLSHGAIRFAIAPYGAMGLPGRV
jgi:hypothetical protein